MTKIDPVKKPLFLIDVDGVVNAWPRSTDEDYSHIDSWGMRVSVHEETVQALGVVVGLAEGLLWLSAWRDKANDEVCAWLARNLDGWPTKLGVITDELGGVYPDMSVDWKIGALREDERVQIAMDAGREVIWIEDFGFEYGDFGASYEAEVRATGVTAIDTTRKGYLSMLELRLAKLISEEAWNASRSAASRSQALNPEWRWAYPAGSLEEL